MGFLYQTAPTQTGDEAPPTLPPRAEEVELIYDHDQAWDYYQKFIKVESIKHVTVYPAWC